MKKFILLSLICIVSLAVKSQMRDTTFTYDGKTIVAQIGDTSVNFISVDSRQITEDENSRAKSCLASAEESCQNDRHCRDVCMLNVVPPVYNPGCLLGWALSCLWGVLRF